MVLAENKGDGRDDDDVVLVFACGSLESFRVENKALFLWDDDDDDEGATGKKANALFREASSSKSSTSNSGLAIHD